MQYENPEIPEGINTTDEHPLKEFVILSSGIVLVSVVIISLILLIVEYSARFIPFEYEQQLVSTFTEQYADTAGEEQQYLQRLANEIVLTQNLPKDMEITVHYVDEEMVNAMATLGGHIIVYRGLLEKLPSENALVMLLAHEIAHIKYRHPIKSLGSQILLQLFWAILTNQSNSSDIIDISQFSSLSYSRSNETLADEEGLHSVFQIYKDVNGATDLFQALIESRQNMSFTIPEYLSTHPDINNRISHLNELAEKNNWPSKKEPLPIQ
ncbi:MAG: M48 family metallopeptidase [Gammaproteobacteria bacterium]|nr:M48 family metallopeptidase [Gammaproteobacteria bacterium]